MNKSIKNAAETAEKIAQEAADFVAIAQCWSLSVGAWSLRAKRLREEREAIDKEMGDLISATTMRLFRSGMPLSEAETHVEKLLEKAFSR